LTVGDVIASSGVDSREARLLLSEASGLPPASLIAFDDRPLPSEAEKRFHGFVERRKRGEPIAYIVGHKEFFDLDLAVTRDVLIPRPETELLVELALEREFTSALDLGTGCGALALALKKHRPASTVTAVDHSPAALSIARINAERLGLHIELLQGEWFQALGSERFDLVLSNPPYVARGDPHLDALRFEPVSALVAGEDGLDAIREIVRCAPRHLEPQGWLLLEHGMGHHDRVQRLLEEAGLESIRTWPDLSGIPRVTGGKAVKSNHGH
jgi:release factor glutamine methyltransferase